MWGHIRRDGEPAGTRKDDPKPTYLRGRERGLESISHVGKIVHLDI